MFRLLPREDKYFEMLNSMASHMTECALLLQKISSDADSSLPWNSEEFTTMIQPQNWNPPNPEVFIDSTFALVAVIGAIALLFDYTNGFHDAANSIATVVSTRVLSPARAAMRAAFFNFIAFYLGTRAVAKTIYSGLDDPKPVNERSRNSITPHSNERSAPCSLSFRRGNPTK